MPIPQRLLGLAGAAAFAAASAAGAAGAAGGCTCPADADGDGTVGFSDLLTVLAQWGPCQGCPGDVTGNGEVDFEDLLAVLGGWGPCRFDYGPRRADPEAEQIGLGMLGEDGPLLVPEDIFQRADRDLDLIREAEPTLADQTHTPAWAPDRLIVKKRPEEPPEEYDRLNACFQIVSEQHLFGDWFLLSYPGHLNVPALAVVYLELSSIEFAEPDRIIGGENFWRPTPQGGGRWRWNIDDGFCDCFDGCDCHRFFVFDVEDGGTVTLVSFNEVLTSCCAF